MDLKALFFTANGRVQLRDLLFGFDGRIPRSRFWLATLVMFIPWVVLFPIFLLLSWLPYLAAGLAIIAAILTLYSSIVVGCKRLHDLGLSGWWQLVVWGAQGLLGVAERQAGANAVMFEYASEAVFIVTMVIFGCLRGTAGPNRYGPDPRAAMPASSATA